MSQNAIYQGEPYHIVDVEHHDVELKSVDEPDRPHLKVDVMAAGLIIEPTDDQWAACPGRT